MTTAGKLWLGFGTLLLILILSGFAIILRVWSVEGKVNQMAESRDRLAAASQLEINVLGYALAVRTYLQTGDAAARRDALDGAEKAEKRFYDYQTRAVTSAHREMAARFVPMWKDLRELGDAMLDVENRQAKPEDAKRLYELRSRLERLVDREMQAEATASYETHSREALQDVRSILSFVAILMIVGAAVAVTTGWLVGGGVVNAEFALQKANAEMEDRVRDRTAELAAANEDLQRSNRELEQFASVASHDLQEPLRKIQAFGDRLRSKFGDRLEVQGSEYIERILASAGRMRTLIDDLLSFSRIATKTQPFVPTDLAAVAHEVVADLEGRIEHSGGRVEVNGLPTLDADPSQMRQVLQNLIANGLKFHRPEVPPVVKIRSQMISGPGNNGATQQFCEITVEDNGIGFDETYLNRIFELFQRLHGRGEYEGTGMGLAICRKIVQRHGGEITAKSTVGQGSTFFVRLPVEQNLR